MSDYLTPVKIIKRERRKKMGDGIMVRFYLQQPAYTTNSGGLQ
ncbi:MAG: hypothetical protein ACYCVH_11190 [Ignavibacteriaceae bacterium]